MSTFKVLPLASELAATIRHGGHDEFGNALVSVVAKGKGPCRHCLHPFDVGNENRILFSYKPFHAHQAYVEVGPVFIHAHECAPFADENKFPAAIKSDLEAFPLTLRCYDTDERMLHAELVGKRNVDEVIHTLFEDPQIDFIYARNAEYGCYIAKVVRS